MSTNKLATPAGFYLYEAQNCAIAATAESYGISESAAFRHLLAIGLQQPLPSSLPLERRGLRMRIGSTRTFAWTETCQQSVRTHIQQLSTQLACAKPLPRAQVVRHLIDVGYQKLTAIRNTPLKTSETM